MTVPHQIKLHSYVFVQETFLSCHEKSGWRGIISQKWNIILNIWMCSVYWGNIWHYIPHSKIPVIWLVNRAGMILTVTAKMTVPEAQSIGQSWAHVVFPGAKWIILSNLSNWRFCSFHLEYKTNIGKSILQVSDTGTRVLDNSRPFWHSSIVCFWMQPAWF